MFNNTKRLEFEAEVARLNFALSAQADAQNSVHETTLSLTKELAETDLATRARFRKAHRALVEPEIEAEANTSFLVCFLRNMLFHEQRYLREASNRVEIARARVAFYTGDAA